MDRSFKRYVEDTIDIYHILKFIDQITILLIDCRVYLWCYRLSLIIEYRCPPPEGNRPSFSECDTLFHLMWLRAELGSDRKLAVFLRTLFVVEVVSFMTLTVYLYVSVGCEYHILLSFLVRPWPLLKSCWGILEVSPNVARTIRRRRLSVRCSGIPFSFFPTALYSWKFRADRYFRVVPSVYQTILMVFALFGAVSTWKETEGLTGANLLKVLIVDQILYFLM